MAWRTPPPRRAREKRRPWLSLKAGAFSRKGENVMKTLVSIFAGALALAFTGAAFAGDVTKAKTEADCKAAGGMWDAETNTCAEKKM